MSGGNGDDRRLGVSWLVPAGMPRTVTRLLGGRLTESTGRVVGYRDGFVLVGWDDGDGLLTMEWAGDLSWPDTLSAAASEDGDGAPR